MNWTAAIIVVLLLLFLIIIPAIGISNAPWPTSPTDGSSTTWVTLSASLGDPCNTTSECETPLVCTPDESSGAKGTNVCNNPCDDTCDQNANYCDSNACYPLIADGQPSTNSSWCASGGLNGANCAQTGSTALYTQCTSNTDCTTGLCISACIPRNSQYSLSTNSDPPNISQIGTTNFKLGNYLTQRFPVGSYCINDDFCESNVCVSNVCVKSTGIGNLITSTTPCASHKATMRYQNYYCVTDANSDGSAAYSEQSNQDTNYANPANPATVGVLNYNLGALCSTKSECISNNCEDTTYFGSVCAPSGIKSRVAAGSACDFSSGIYCNYGSICTSGKCVNAYPTSASECANDNDCISWGCVNDGAGSNGICQPIDGKTPCDLSPYSCGGDKFGFMCNPSTLVCEKADGVIYTDAGYPIITKTTTMGVSPYSLPTNKQYGVGDVLIYNMVNQPTNVAYAIPGSTGTVFMSGVPGNANTTAVVYSGVQ